MRRIHLKVFDIHSDLFTDIAWRRSRGETDVFDRIHYPKLKLGGVDSMICVFWVEPAFRNNPLARFQDVFQHTLNDLRHSKHANICLTVEDMDDAPDKINLFLGIEGITFIEQWGKDSLDDNFENAFDFLHNNKIRHSIFVWNESNAFASGTGSINPPNQKGLTCFGKSVVQKTADLHWIHDVSHLDEASFWDLYHATDQPLIASHSNAYTICPHERNLTDAQIKAIAAREGLIGLNAFHGFVHETTPSVDTFIDHAAYIAELVGPEYLAFGFDFTAYLADYDIGVSFSGTTVGLENTTKIPDLLNRMKARGFSTQDLEKISFTNAFEFMKKQLRN